MNLKMPRIISWFCMLCTIVAMGASGCSQIAPARVPAQLDNTPGPAVIVTWDTYISTAFTVNYPAGWEVITSPAFSQPWVVFTSPDEMALIAVAVDAADIDDIHPSSAGESGLRRDTEIVTLANDTGVTVLLISAEDFYEVTHPIFEVVANTLHTP